MVTLNYIPQNKRYNNDFYKKKSYKQLIEKNAKFKGFCIYFTVTRYKLKLCSKYNNLCGDNEFCKIRKNTLKNVLSETIK